MTQTAQMTISPESFAGEMTNLFNQLAEHFAAEKDYDKIADYQEVLQKDASEYGVTITQMTQRPFGFVFREGNRKYWFRKVRGRLVFTESAI